MKWVKIIASPTIWVVLGTTFGFYYGSQSGFRHGVTLTSQMVLEILRETQKEHETPTTQWPLITEN